MNLFNTKTFFNAALSIGLLCSTAVFGEPTTSADPLLGTEIRRDLPLVELETTQGTFTLQLLPYAAPKACENFLKLVENGYYNNTPFHRIIPGFMVQGGDPTGKGTGGQSIWDKPFEDEYFKGLNFDRPGILAMANAGPNTNGSQFFITLEPTPWLNNKHTIFGIVAQGSENVFKLGAEGSSSGVPKSAQQIIKARVIFMPSTSTNQSDNVLPLE